MNGIHRENGEARLDFLQERFEADAQGDTPFGHQGSQFHERDVGNGQTFSISASCVDCSLCLARDLFWLERQPDNHVRIYENHLSSPHSSAVSAGDTTSPVTVPLPAKKL
jgi:hypothetical protein